MEDDFEKELKIGFLEEAWQLLADTEQAFLDLETAIDDPSLIERIFRLAHNLKGSARAVGFGTMAEFTHEFESLLLKIRKGELEITANAVNLLLACNDHLKTMVEALKQNMDAVVDSGAIIERISTTLAGIASSEPQSGVSPAPGRVAIVEAFEREEISQVPSSPVAAAVDAEAFEAVEVEEIEEAMAVAELPPASAFIEVTESKIEKEQGMDAEKMEAVGEQESIAQVVPIVAKSVEGGAPAAAAGGAAAGSGQAEESIRVSLKRLEGLMNNVGELVILQAVLNQQKTAVASLLVQKTIDQLAKITKDIQDISMSLRMVPLRQTFQKMQRIVRDTSKALNKDVKLDLSGEDTELDKTVLEQVGDPLVHLVRNAVDHGLETPAERIERGKPAQGVVQLKAFHRGGHIAIEVSDDGWGLDAKKLTKIAIDKGILRPGTVLADEDAYKLIFASGFSTKEKITDISGRGVGMDVVRSNIEALQGDIQIETELGVGTTFRIMLPLTLSIIDGMVIRAAGERYVVPISQVHESVQPAEADVQVCTGVGEVLVLRGENIPLFRLGRVLGRSIQKERALSDSIAIVIRTNKAAYAMLVDDIIGNQQVVIKRLGNEVQHLKGISGGAILGDGKASLILDFHELVHRTLNMHLSTKASDQMKGAA